MSEQIFIVEPARADWRKPFGKLLYPWFHVQLGTGHDGLRGPCERLERCRAHTAPDGVGRRVCNISSKFNSPYKWSFCAELA